jgi:hypothetical protein
MQRRTFARKALGHVDLDMCFPCHAIWFDPYESTALTPGAVIALFREIQSHPEQPPRPLAERCRCPKCRKVLVLAHDLQRANRITYYRCADGHGRLSTFVQFLREKSFVRSLTAGEIDQLRVHVAQVRCSSCGAPVNVERDAQCGYCRAPIAILDADAVKRTLAELDAAERSRQRVDPQAAIDGLLAGKRTERRLAMAEGAGNGGAWPFAVDLVSDALDLLFRDH